MDRPLSGREDLRFGFRARLVAATSSANQVREICIGVTL
jgi:hypothetical protein